jgi:ribonuclease HII
MLLWNSLSDDFAACFATGELVVGVDEAGRGPLAGPVVAARCCCASRDRRGLDDCEEADRRSARVLEERIRRRCAFGIGVVEVERHRRDQHLPGDDVGDGAGGRAAVRGDRLRSAPGAGRRQPDARPGGAEWRWPARAIVGGDACEPCISAASILAKEHRDRLMREYAAAHPHYGWDSNKGYGTPEHLEALRVHGPTPLHRRSFAPVAQLELFG